MVARNLRGDVSLLVTLVLSTLLGGSAYILQTLSIHRAKQEAEKTQRIEAYYSAEYAAWHNYTRFIDGLDNGGQTYQAPVESSYLHGLSQNKDAYTPNDDPGTPVNLARTSEFDGNNSVVRRLAGGNIKYEAPVTTGSTKAVCGTMEINRKTYRTCLTGTWNPPSPSLVAVGDPSPNDGVHEVPEGAVVTLNWSSPVSRSCELTPSNTQGTSNQEGLNTGSHTTLPVNSSTLYRVLCSGPGGEAEKTLQINISANKPVADLKVDGSDGPVTVNEGSTVTITWTSKDATSCQVDPLAATGLNGSNTRVINADEEHTLTCTGPGGTSSDSVKIQKTADYVSTVTARHGVDGLNLLDANGRIYFNGQTGVVAYQAIDRPYGRGIGREGIYVQMTFKITTLSGKVLTHSHTGIFHDAAVRSTQLPGAWGTAKTVRQSASYSGRSCTARSNPCAYSSCNPNFAILPPPSAYQTGFQWQDGARANCGAIHLRATWTLGF